MTEVNVNVTEAPPVELEIQETSVAVTVTEQPPIQVEIQEQEGTRIVEVPVPEVVTITEPATTNIVQVPSIQVVSVALPGGPTGGVPPDVLKKASSANFDVEWGRVHYTELEGTPSTFPPSSHNHDERYYTESESDARYKPLAYVPAWTDITGKPSVFPPDAHNHDALYSPLGHNHDARYFTETESDGRYIRTVNDVGPDEDGNVDVATGGGGVSDHGALTGLGDDDHPQYHNDARGDARYSILSHTHDHIVPLAEDAFAEADPITDYPSGISSMPVSDTADWAEQSTAATIITEYTDNGGWQQAIFYYGYIDVRFWNTAGDEWFDWLEPVYRGSIYTGITDSVVPIGDNTIAEFQPVTDFPHGITLMEANGAQNWGPNDGEAGRVLTQRTDSTGTQFFHANNGNTYRRIYESGDWGSWSAFSMEGHTHDHIAPLDEDEFAEADPITDWPLGISEMVASISGGWRGGSDDLQIATHHVATDDSGHFGIQYCHFASSPNSLEWRTFDGVDEEWSEWTSLDPVATILFYLSIHEDGLEHQRVRLLSSTDWIISEDDDLGSYPHGVSVLPVPAEDNWGPNTGEAGLLTTEYDLDEASGVQTLRAFNGNTYRRAYAAFSWQSWTAFSMEGHEHSAAEITSGTLDDARIPSGIARDSEVTSAISAHEATSDPHPTYLTQTEGDGRYLQSAYNQTIKEDGTARTQRANVNFTHGLDAADNSGTGATDVSVDESELTHNSLGGLTSGDPHTQYHNDTRGDARYTPIAHVGSGGTAHANAVASGAAGFLTGSDKAKLDGVETGATADQTASEILTALLTVDGTGSLLDADKLDGNDSTAFVQTTRTISTTAPLTGGGDLSANRTLAVSTATETAEGVSERATQAETNTGTDDVRYVSPAKLANYTGITNKALASDLTSHIGSGGTAHANAVASGAAGFLTGTDKAKLDGIESGATADQTASEILTALLTVDGSGSLLDADKLDGNDTTYFTNATNLSSGTVPTARLGSGTADSTTVLKGDNTWGSISAGSLSLTEVEVDLSSTIVQSGSFQITGLSGLTAGRHVLIRQALGPYTNKGTLADEYEMDSINVAGKVTNATTIQCYWKSDGPVRGNFKFAYAVG